MKCGRGSVRCAAGTPAASKMFRPNHLSASGCSENVIGRDPWQSPRITRFASASRAATHSAGIGEIVASSMITVSNRLASSSFSMYRRVIVVAIILALAISFLLDDSSRVLDTRQGVLDGLQLTLLSGNLPLNIRQIGA
jgi:hypothetical protein